MDCGAIKSEEPFEIFDYYNCDKIDLTTENDEDEIVLQLPRDNMVATKQESCDVIELDDDDDDDHEGDNKESTNKQFNSSDNNAASITDGKESTRFNLPEILNFMCSICQEVLPTTRLYEKHLLEHDTGQECSLLPEAVSADVMHKTEISTNQITNNINKPVKVSRKGCSKLPTSVYVCSQCTEQFTIKREFVRHVKQHSKKQLPFACSLCPKSYLTMASLIIHESSHQTPFRPYLCKKCFLGFEQEKYLQDHLHMHKLAGLD